jgi:Protein of unknown function (DUF2934)
MAKPKNPRSNGGKTRAKQTPATDLQLASDSKQNVIPINLEEEIRRRAYELYEQRGCEPGREHEDWLVAERELLSRYSQQQSA